MSVENAVTGRPGLQRSSRFARLTSDSRMYLRVEDPAWPTHFCGLAIVDGRALWGASGQLRLEEIRDRLDRRLTRVPELRRRVYFPGPLRGGPLWVDDGRFAIEHHVQERAVETREAMVSSWRRPPPSTDACSTGRARSGSSGS